MNTFCSLLCCGLCVRGNLDIVVSHKTSPPAWILFLFFNYFTLTLMSDFVLLTESMWDTERESATENSDPFYGQTLCHTWVAKPRHHCICFISMVLPIIGLTTLNVWNIKTSRFWSSGQSKNKKKGLKRWWGDRQIMKRYCISLKMSVFFGTLPLQLINLY